MEQKRISNEEAKIIMVEILEQFDKYCKAHQLRYFLGAGTLLGAIRHHGFIPWDDDIDVLMPIEDYKRLFELAAIEPLGKNLFLSDYQHNPKHVWLVPKLFRTDTFYTEPHLRKSIFENYTKEIGGICIDIFPIYGLPNNKIKRNFFEAQIRIKQKASGRMISKITISKYRPLTQRYVICFIKLFLLPLYWIYERIYGFGKNLNEIYNLITKYDYNQAEYVGTALGYAKNETVSKHCFDQAIEGQFEHLKCPIPVGYDEYLRTLYGDYMVMPPVNKRNPHPRSDTYWRN